MGTNDKTTAAQEPRFLTDVTWNPNTLPDGKAVVLRENHWQMLVQVATSNHALPLADGSDMALTAQELLAWGLIVGQLAVATDDEVLQDTPDPELEGRNQQYRDLRDLRRGIQQR